MRLHFNSISRRLYTSFGFLVFNIALLSGLSFYYLQKYRQISLLLQRIDQQRILTVQLLKLDLDFLRFETVNQEFYKTGVSPVLRQRDKLEDSIRLGNARLRQDLEAIDFLDPTRLRNVDSLRAAYHATFATLVLKIKERGFKDYGLEGRMRKFAHELENYDKSLPLSEVLTLRRHEKDFFLRKEDIYISQFEHEAEQMGQTIATKHGASSFLLFLLNSYRQAFLQLAKLDKEIGLVPTQGLLQKLNEQTNVLSRQLTELNQMSNQQANQLLTNSIKAFAVVGMLSIGLSLLFTYLTARGLVRPIKKLSGTLGKFLVHEELEEKDWQIRGSATEIRQLSTAFVTLSKRLKKQFDEIEEKSALLESQNDELKKLNEELDRFIYSAAHDLKSPLASLSGLIYLARKEMAYQDHDHYFQMMNKSVSRLEGFIRDITDYARNKRQTVHVEKVNPEEMLLQTLEELMHLSGADRVEKSVQVTGKEFYSDSTRVRIIVKNLLSNALRYADFSKSQSFVRVMAVVSAEKAVITFEDNGIGIEAIHQPRIFDMFYRASEASAGTGIGLFLVRETVKILQGKINLVSTPGVGSTFSLELPNHLLAQGAKKPALPERDIISLSNE